MKVSELLDSRQGCWRELERLCVQLEGRSRRKLPAATVSRFATLYRAACADLALADAYQLPPTTIHYLHQLVANAHNQLYRSRTFEVSNWTNELFVAVPQRLFTDNCVRLAFAIFWSIFICSAAMAYHSASYAESVIGRETLMSAEQNFANPLTGRPGAIDNSMVAFYIWHNAGIGLQCFAFGLLFGFGGLFTTVFNAAHLGALFGYMAGRPAAENFFHFVTAHGPLELTAVVLAAGAGMRLGFSLVDTQGYSRAASLRRAAQVAMPTACLAILMFLGAAGIEAFISPSAAPYALKAGIGIASAGLLTFYFVILGFPREQSPTSPFGQR